MVPYRTGRASAPPPPGSAWTASARQALDLLLTGIHDGFLVRPWFTHVAKALRTKPQWFLRDWSGVDDEGARAETSAQPRTIAGRG